MLKEEFVAYRSHLMIRVLYETYLWYGIVTTICVQVIIIQKTVLC